MAARKQLDKITEDITFLLGAMGRDQQRKEEEEEVEQEESEVSEGLHFGSFPQKKLLIPHGHAFHSVINFHCHRYPRCLSAGCEHPLAGHVAPVVHLLQFCPLSAASHFY